MAVVDFQQDPGEPFGTGNFRDDKGRVMYLHDPETAALFNKTIPGVPLGKKVADEANDIADARTNPNRSLPALVGNEANFIAEQRLGVPKPGPDLRVAGPGGYDASLALPNEAARGAAPLGLATGAPPVQLTGSPGGGAPDESSVANPGAALVEKTAGAVQSLTPGAAPPSPQAAPAVPGAAPGAPAPAVVPGGAPGGTPAAPAGGPGAALVGTTADAVSQLSARSKSRDVPLPAPKPSGGLPLHGTRSAEGVSIDEGRPLENVLEQVKEEDTVANEGIAALRKQGRDKDIAAQAGMRQQMAGQSGLYGQSVDAVFRANAERRQAEEQQARVQKELLRNDQDLDPERYVNSMSTGKRVSMIILAALNGAFGATIGQSHNQVLDALNDNINRDFEKQKMEVANKKVTLGNEYKRYLDMGLDAKQAEALWRDRAAQALFQFKDIEAKRTATQGQHAREAEVLVQPLRQAAVQRRGDVLAQAEAKVKRTRDESISHEVPPPALVSPQDMLALLGVKKEKIEQANAEQVAALIGHDVSPEEANRYRQDAQEYGDKNAVNEDALFRIAQAAEGVGAVKDTNRKSPTFGQWIPGPNGVDPGSRPLGISQSDRAVKTDRRWQNMVDGRVQASKREPAQRLQEASAKSIERPFQDDQIVGVLNDTEALVQNAKKLLRHSYGDAALLWDRTNTDAPTPPARPATPGPPARAAGTSPAQRAAAEAERKKTLEMMQTDGELRDE